MDHRLLLPMFALLCAAAVAATASSGTATAFTCETSTALPQSLSADKVGDGICDCCDGTDEPQLPCPNKCAARLAKAASDLSSLEAAIERGVAATPRVVIPPRAGQSLIDELGNRFSSLKLAFEAASRAHSAAAQRLQKALATARRAPSDAELAVLSSLEAPMNEMRSEAASLQGALRVNDFGRSQRLISLLGAPCVVSTPVSEKQSKGGSTTAAPKHYVYAVCGYGNVTQFEYEPERWKLGDDADTRLGTALLSADGTVATGEGDPVSFGSPTFLGAFSGYLPLSALDDHIAVGAVLNDDPRTVQQLYKGTRRPRLPSPLFGLPDSHAAELGDTVMYYEGTQPCQVEDMIATRRAYVIHVCPGVTPALLHAWGAIATALSLPPTIDVDPPWTKPRALPSRYAQLPWNSAADRNAARVVPPALGARAVAAGANISSAALQQLPRVVHVEEDGLCAYKVYVATPLACSRTMLKDVQAARAKLKRRGGGKA